MTVKIVAERECLWCGTLTKRKKYCCEKCRCNYRYRHLAESCENAARRSNLAEQIMDLRLEEEVAMPWDRSAIKNKIVVMQKEMQRLHESIGER